MKVLVLGGGVLGRAIAEALMGEFDVTIIEKDVIRAQTLAESGLQVVQGDFSYTATLLKAHIERADLVIITTTDVQTIAKTLHVVRTNNKDVSVLVILPEDVSVEDIENILKEQYETEAKIDYIINPRTAIVRAVVETIEKVGESKNARKLINKLNEIKERAETLLIVMHDNPDPDSMASASALALIAQTVGLKTQIVYGGDITHHQNRAMVNVLGMDLRRVSRGSYEIKRHSAIAIVDAQPNGNITILDEDDLKKVEIIIDHHQILQNLKERLNPECFIDIRPDVNATSSIMVEYLKALEIPINDTLATALFYGMYIDTKKFSKLSRIDIKAIEFLTGKVNYDLLDKIEFPDISTETAEILARAILNRKIYKNVVISNVGFIANRDAIAEAADFLLRLEGITTVLVFGIVDDRIEISARTRDVRINIGAIMKEAFGDIGSGGGHAQAGGARIPLGIFKLAKDKTSLLRLVEEAITEKFLEALGMKEGP
ncbi:phosphoesterase [Thermococcus chitonophagus]|uniref:Phosphoesterase n=1 Tax=Thermococcus chitonophagus TaxID=54262 RepID=A0A160VRP5_9EURY|nr:DHH family phosphoesterase [Thermococcus chitonophagus]ASJ15804.1 phosphoesterase [Thermococcus chitonophagus]CUX77036.1 Trk system potassium uptake protein TrkA [Thermococcus chitonophagus]